MLFEDDEDDLSIFPSTTFDELDLDSVKSENPIEPVIRSQLVELGLFSLNHLPSTCNYTLYYFTLSTKSSPEPSPGCLVLVRYEYIQRCRHSLKNLKQISEESSNGSWS